MKKISILVGVSILLCSDTTAQQNDPKASQILNGVSREV